MFLSGPVGVSISFSFSTSLDLRESLTQIVLFDLTLSLMCPEVHSFLLFANKTFVATSLYLYIFISFFTKSRAFFKSFSNISLNTSESSLDILRHFFKDFVLRSSTNILLSGSNL